MMEIKSILIKDTTKKNVFALCRKGLISAEAHVTSVMDATTWVEVLLMHFMNHISMVRRNFVS